MHERTTLATCDGCKRPAKECARRGRLLLCAFCRMMRSPRVVLAPARAPSFAR